MILGKSLNLLHTTGDNSSYFLRQLTELYEVKVDSLTVITQ